MNQKRGEDVTSDGACFAYWHDKDDPNIFHIAQGDNDRITLTRFQAVVLGKVLLELDGSI